MTDALAASYAFCDTITRREAKNFYHSFRLLPADRRRSMCALYAFMRKTDDLADDSGEIPAKAEALRSWRAELDASLCDRPSNWPGLLAMADTVARHAIPPKHLHEVIDGVEMDLSPVTYDTFDDLYAYCYRVASAVGLCCLSIWGYQSDDGRAEAMAEACGIALQLTNILRDVGEDARNDRIYLPRDELRQFGVTDADLLAKTPSDAARDLFRFHADRAADYYRKASPLASLVDPVGRPVLGAIVGIYRGLLDEIVRRDYDVLSARVALPSWKKALIAVSALPSRFGRTTPSLAEPTS